MSSLRILSYNLSWEAQTGTNSQYVLGSLCVDANRKNICQENVVNLIAASESDVIFLQEATINGIALRDRISHGVNQYAAFIHQSQNEKIMTIYNTKLGDARSIGHEFSPGRPFLIVICREYVFVNLHRGRGIPIQDDIRKIEQILTPQILESRRVIIGGDFNKELQAGYITLSGKDLDLGKTLQTRKTCCSSTLGKRDRNYIVQYDYIGIDEKLKFDRLFVPVQDINTYIQHSDHLPVFAIVSPKDSDVEENGIVVKNIPENTRLYRGINVQCNRIPEPIRRDRHQWFAQTQTTALKYSKLEPQNNGCLFAFTSVRPLRLVNLWSKMTIEYVINRYNILRTTGQVSQEEIDAFRIFSGYGIDKKYVSGQEYPPITLAKQYNWAANNTQTTYEYIQVSDDLLPEFKKINETSITWNRIVWGPGIYELNRTSTFKGDTIVMDTLRNKIFANSPYDGVYCTPTPSSFHRGVFPEEFILFPDASTKLREFGHKDILATSFGGRRRLLSGPKQKGRRSSSSSKKRYTRRRRALHSGKVGYRARVTGRKV